MEITTIRPCLLNVLVNEVKSCSSYDNAEKKITEISRDTTRRLENQCAHEKNVLADEVAFARMLLRGLFAGKNTALRKVAEDFVKAAAADQAKDEK